MTPCSNCVRSHFASANAGFALDPQKGRVLVLLHELLDRGPFGLEGRRCRGQNLSALLWMALAVDVAASNMRAASDSAFFSAPVSWGGSPSWSGGVGFFFASGACVEIHRSTSRRWREDGRRARAFSVGCSGPLFLVAARRRRARALGVAAVELQFLRFVRRHLLERALRGDRASMALVA